MSSKTISAIVVLGLLVQFSCPLQTRAERPNVVLLLADDLGWTGLGCFGSDLYETPNLDKLCSQGIKFTNAYSACAVCSPTRASVMTGMYPARLRLTDFIAGQNRPFAKMRIPDWTKGLESQHVTIAEALKAVGYKTAHLGKWHLASANGAKNTDPGSQGFDVSISRPKGTRGYFLKENMTSDSGSNYLTDWLTDKACEFIHDNSKQQPFFLYFAYNVPHTPIQGRDDLVKKFRSKLKPELTHNNPTYAAMVASLDQSVGRVLQTLDEHGVRDNTIVIFTSDNGGLTQRYGKHDRFTENLPLRRGKGSAYEGGVRVPAIIHWPGVTTPSVCSEPIMTTDYYPTILEATGAGGHDQAPGANVDGRSLIGLLKDTQTKLDRSLFWHYPHYHAGGDGPYSAIRNGPFRLIQFHEDMSLRLYDLRVDIGEQKDLAMSNPKRAKELLAELQEWRSSVGAQMPTPNPEFDAKKQTKVSRRKKQ